MIKIAIELATVKEQGKDKHVKRVIVMQAEEIPELQDKPFWTVRDIIQYDEKIGTSRMTDMITDLIEAEPCEVIAVCCSGRTFDIHTFENEFAGSLAPALINQAVKAWKAANKAASAEDAA